MPDMVVLVAGFQEFGGALKVQIESIVPGSRPAGAFVDVNFGLNAAQVNAVLIDAAKAAQLAQNAITL
jgi:hypothetical protein